MSGQPNIDDYLQKGMYGEKQVKPDEKRKFLGTFRERVIIALKNSQVMENKVYTEIDQLLKANPCAKLLLNGELNYPSLSKYIQLAKRYGNPYSIVTNNDSNTSIGLVLALDHAINKEDIYITTSSKQQKEKAKKKGLLSSLKGALVKGKRQR
ncbi:YueI family protein [Heyndrickxia sp. NPDC080065]|uniref:YueI family protein n=1 Tax=Heyndrickxia sp. NPDC080065 TaxID=3390568 RepID=UPI003CFD3F8D